MKIDIKEYVNIEKEKIKNKIKCLNTLHLLILQIGDDPASNSYIKGKLKDAKDCGIGTTLFKTSSYNAMIPYLRSMGSKYTGIILQEPCNLNSAEKISILDFINDIQDVDGFKNTSKHKPCTPAGIIEIIKTFYPKEEINGDIAVVVGKGELVGKPLVPMLMEMGFTVISCNSKTKDLSSLTKIGDIVVSAVGKSNLITRDMLKDGAFVIDAGITFDEKGKLRGDCDKSMYDDEKIAITTVPGGVGLMTRLMLMKNTAEAGFMAH